MERWTAFEEWTGMMMSCHEGRSARRWWCGVLGILLLVVGGCHRDEASSGPQAERASEELPDQQISDFVLRETKGGQLAWVLRAETARIFEKENEIRAEKFHVDFYDEEGQVASVMTAHEGTVHRRTNAMLARGEVVVRSNDGRVLETESLHYDPREKKVHTDDFVRIVDGRNVLTGYGLESDPDLRDGTFEIKRDVEATVLDLPEEPAPATGESGS